MKKRNVWKGFLAMLLVVTNLVSMPAGIESLADNTTNDVVVYGMTVNDKKNPIGIDDATPTFGWRLQSSTMGQEQTAYQIVVSKEQEMTSAVWDSGKVVSSDTTDIVCGAELEECTRYYWQVTVWDMNDTAVQSDVAYFETAFITTAPLNGANWIEVSESPYSSVGSSINYQIDVDILEVTTTAAFIFGNTKWLGNGTLMWQVQDKGSYFQLVPHWRTSTWNTTTVVFAEGEEYTNKKTNGFHLTIAADEEKICTYVDGTLISTVTEETMGISTSIGYVGVREGTNEGVTIDNLRVTDYSLYSSGEVLANYDFSETYPTFANAESVIENGVYKAYDTDGDNWFGQEYLADGLTSLSASESIKLYSVEADISCTAVAASLCFNVKDTSNLLMWQIVRTDTAVKLRPHKMVSGKFTAYTDVDITDAVTPAQLAEGVNFRVEVTTNTIHSYVNNTLVDSFDVSQLGAELFLGRFATRVATNEVFTLSNLKAVSYSESSKGEVLFDYSCENFNPFFRGKLNNGKVEMNTDNGTGILLIHAGTATFRKQFDTEKTVENARLYITSYGSFNAYLNGARIGNQDASGEIVYDELAPGWTDEAERICYYTYDITDNLLSGSNTLAVGVNYGWSGIALYYSNEPSTPHKLMAYVKVEYTDGTSEIIVTDDSWKSAYVGPVMSGDIFQGEYYDATADVSYRLNDYDDSLWGAAKEVTYSTNIVARDGGQIYVRKDLERVPQCVNIYSDITDAVDETQYGKINISATYGDEQFTLKKGETAVVDFGQNFAGWENITFSGETGTEVLIRHAEILNDNMGLISRGNDGPEGSVYTANLRNAPARTIYRMNGETASYRPTSTYYGFRYLEITATGDITIEKIRGEVATSVEDNTGTFETSDALINQLYSNTLWGQYSNYFGQATDCPQRDERLGYSGDAQVFVGTAVYHSNVKAFLRNFLLTLEEGQADDGAYGNTMPGKSDVGSVWAGVAGWADAGIIVPYTYYKQYGDVTVLEDMYASMTEYMDYLVSCGEERIGQKFGDWLSYATNDTQMINYISYVYTIWDAQMMQEIASILGKTDDVQKYEEMEQTYLGYFQNKFLDENGDLIMSQQTAYLFALKLGLYKDEAAWNRGKELLVVAIEENGNCLNTGFLGTSIIMETLVEIGESDLAYELLFQDSDPSWLFSVKQGATTMWERWNSYSIASGFGSVSMNSFNHYSYGCVAEFMYANMLGIMPADAGYETIVIEPKTTDKLEYVSGSYDSVNGLIQSAWNKDENGLYHYNFTVPMNATAVIKLEEQSYGTYYVNGVRYDQLSKGAGVTYVGNQEGLEVFEVVSGAFAFTSEEIPKLEAEKLETNEIFEFQVEGLSEYSSKQYTASGKGWYTFPETEKEIVDTLNNKFHFYYDREGTYYERTIFTNGDTADTYGGSSAYDTRWILLYDHFLQRQGSKKYGEIFRKIDTMVPLTSTGKEVYVKNFETTYDIRFESEDYGAVILGFRQQTPGKFTNGLYKLVQNQAFVAIGRKGITIAGGTDIYAKKDDANDMYNSFQTEVYETALPQEISVKVRVVGTTCEVTIYDRASQEQLYSYTETIPYESAGAISYGVSTVGHDIGNIKLTALNDEGELCDIATPYNENQDILMYRNGKIEILGVTEAEDGYEYTLWVQPDEGWFMRTNSLTVETMTEVTNQDSVYNVIANGGIVSAEFYKIGDVNYDSSVDIVDLVRLKKVCDGETTETVEQDADCNGDNVIDNQDIDELRRILIE